MISTPQKTMIAAAKERGILWADVSTRIPEPDNSVEAVYSSHMFEHLEREKAFEALRECLRVLQPGGVMRIVVPDVRYHVDKYLTEGDADKFLDELMLSRPRPKTIRGKLRYLFVGSRHHQWMYDGPSLCKLLTSVGFIDPQVLCDGQTRIKNPGALDLREREVGSVIVEAIKP
jgi:predicted SAM-dependent methyltransferase